MLLLSQLTSQGVPYVLNQLSNPDMSILHTSMHPFIPTSFYELIIKQVSKGTIFFSF
jgi:hypothetical protein